MKLVEAVCLQVYTFDVLQLPAINKTCKSENIGS